MTLRTLFTVLVMMAGLQAMAQDAPPPEEAEILVRAEAIQKTLRCVVCQNQSIADSNSTLAEDMRSLVEKRVRLGETDDEVRAYMQARYGDFVLMTPPMKASTYLLWFAPFLLVIAGGIWFLLKARFRRSQSDPIRAGSDLSPSEKTRLNQLIADDYEKDGGV